MTEENENNEEEVFKPEKNITLETIFGKDLTEAKKIQIETYKNLSWAEVSYDIEETGKELFNKRLILKIRPRQQPVTKDNRRLLSVLTQDYDKYIQDKGSYKFPIRDFKY